uniref:SAYSvFN domain-containing protein n=1 Tax=Timspurckia oligopyrenoides TaxID=708627 RepID=A0A7S0ZK60_9RHOD|mmetsp:Transcript_8382/g.15158  ORF Transcript_8382/g.15158 Transcript_8382/m.15158 type:complete len:136 (+) Transcript_8382:298-705(+)
METGQIIKYSIGFMVWILGGWLIVVYDSVVLQLYFIFSVFGMVVYGLCTSKARNPDELSAYSVFNPNCQSLLGDLKAEQLDSEIRHDPVNDPSNRNHLNFKSRSENQMDEHERLLEKTRQIAISNQMKSRRKSNR